PDGKQVRIGESRFVFLAQKMGHETGSSAVHRPLPETERKVNRCSLDGPPPAGRSRCERRGLYVQNRINFRMRSASLCLPSLQERIWARVYSLTLANVRLPLDDDPLDRLPTERKRGREDRNLDRDQADILVIANRVERERVAREARLQLRVQPRDFGGEDLGRINRAVPVESFRFPRPCDREENEVDPN